MVVIKSYQGGLSIHLNDKEPFDEMLTELGAKFDESRRFFKNAPVAISVEGRHLSNSEEISLLQTIEEHSDLNIICIVGKNEETNKQFVKALKRVEQQIEESNCRYYKGNVMPDQMIDSDGNLFILGNVSEGATIAAGKDIVVMGECNGEVYAGLTGEPGHFVMAARMNPKTLKINGNQYHGKKAGLFGKSKNEACVIYEKEGLLVCEAVNPETFANVASVQTN